MLTTEHWQERVLKSEQSIRDSERAHTASRMDPDDALDTTAMLARAAASSALTTAEIAAEANQQVVRVHIGDGEFIAIQPGEEGMFAYCISPTMALKLITDWKATL